MRLAAVVRRRIAWIALLAILVAALAPAMNHAFAADLDPTDWVCAQGPAKTAYPGDGGAPLAPKASHIDHCPYCSPHGASVALPAASSTDLLPVVAAAFPVPSLFFHAPRPLYAWTSTQPRAPPPAP